MSVTTDRQSHTIRTQNGPFTVQATSPAPGLWIYKIPDEVEPATAFRWRIGHHSGLAIACALYEDDVKRAAEKIVDLADWIADFAALRSAVNTDELYLRVGLAGCEHPNNV